MRLFPHKIIACNSSIKYLLKKKKDLGTNLKVLFLCNKKETWEVTVSFVSTIRYVFDKNFLNERQASHKHKKAEAKKRKKKETKKTSIGTVSFSSSGGHCWVHQLTFYLFLLCYMKWNLLFFFFYHEVMRLILVK